MNQPFLKYLTDYYFSIPEKWSIVFRKASDHCNVNVNMFVESFHNQLKTFYLSGKGNRRIDVLIHTLLRFENDHLIKHLHQVSYNNSTENDMHTIDRHDRGLEIDDNKVK